jgi:hypothetical protein
LRGRSSLCMNGSQLVLLSGELVLQPGIPEISNR